MSRLNKKSAYIINFDLDEVLSKNYNAIYRKIDAFGETRRLGTTSVFLLSNRTMQDMWDALTSDESSILGVIKNISIFKLAKDSEHIVLLEKEEDDEWVTEQLKNLAT